MAKNSVTFGASVSAGDVVVLHGTRVEHSSAGVSFKYKRPRSSKQLVTHIGLDKLIVSTQDTIAFYGDQAHYGQSLYDGELTGVESFALGVNKAVDGDGNVVLFGSKHARLIKDADDEGEKPAKKANGDKKKKAKKD